MAAVTAAIMCAAAVITTVVFAVAVFMVMMVASDIWVIAKTVHKQSFHCCITGAAYTAIEFDACICKSCLCTAAYSAADKNISTDNFQKTSQSTMSLTICVNHFGRYNFVAFNFINFELRCMTKVLEHLSVFISNCNFHNKFWYILNDSSDRSQQYTVSFLLTILKPLVITIKKHCKICKCVFIYIFHNKPVCDLSHIIFIANIKQQNSFYLALHFC